MTEIKLNEQLAVLWGRPEEEPSHLRRTGRLSTPICPIYMGRINYEYLDGMKNGNSQSAVEELFRSEGFPEKILNVQDKENQGRRYSVKQMFPAKLVDDGTMILLGDLEIQCVHTPGHTPGHMALYLPKEQLLFTGDHILFDITPNISVWNGVPHSLEDYLGLV